MAATKKKSKKAGKRFYKFLWQGIRIGFEGNAYLTEPDRERHLKTARRAIEDTFKKSALRRWTDGTWKKARVERGEGHVRGLARLVADELNNGVKKSVGLKFRVRPEDPIVGVELESREAISLGPDIKPDGTLCWRGPNRWEDDLTFNMLAERSNDRTGRARVSVWKPDGRHPMLVRLSYDCPYEPRRRR